MRSSTMTIHTPTQRTGLGRLSVFTLALAILVFGFAAGQAAPNVVEAIGATLGSVETQAVAPALTKADDYATRHAAAAPALTKADDYATRHAGQ
jgi:hypothetical protein